MQKPKIPFRLLPASWGLRGKSYLEAEANYYLDGEDLDRRLLDIREENPIERRYLNLDVDLKYGKISKYDYEKRHLELEYQDDRDRLYKAMLKLDLDWHKIEPYAYDVKLAEATHTDKDLKLALLDIDLKHRKIVDRQYAMQKATLNEEPFIAIVNSFYEPKEGLDGLAFEFEWNDLWIQYLKLNGYVGHNEDQMVEQWFRDVCRSVLLEDTDGFLSDEDFPFAATRYPNQEQ